MDISPFARPQGVVDVVLDTDAYAEVDDQYAISYLLHAPERARILALCAAPFSYPGVEAPQGMEDSYREIHHLLELMNKTHLAPLVHRGAQEYLPDEATPVDSPAAREIARLARQHTQEKPLYVLSIGCITNVASAILLDQSAARNMVIVWLGGSGHHWPEQGEYNMRQDVAAARVVFNSDAALVQLPCQGVVDHLTTTGPELMHYLHGKNALCTYLVEHTIQDTQRHADGKPWSRVIWDIAAVAWLLDEESRMVRQITVPTPIPQYDLRYSFDPRRKPMGYVYALNRDTIFEDLFRRLTK